MSAASVESVDVTVETIKAMDSRFQAARLRVGRCSSTVGWRFGVETCRSWRGRRESRSRARRNVSIKRTAAAPRLAKKNVRAMMLIA